MRIAIVVAFVLFGEGDKFLFNQNCLTKLLFKAVCTCHGHRTSRMRDNNVRAQMHKERKDKVENNLLDAHILRFFIELEEKFKSMKLSSSSSSYVADSDYDDNSSSSSTEEVQRKDKITQLTYEEMWDHLNKIEEKNMTKQQLLNHLIRRRVQLKMIKHEIRKLNSVKVIS